MTAVGLADNRAVSRQRSLVTLLPAQEDPVPPDDRSPSPEPDYLAEDVVAGRDPGTAVLRGQGAATAVVAVGGALGALARWAVGLALPAAPGAFPLGTFLVNVVGCLLMGVLVVHVSEIRQAHPLVRPFLGVGVLGGFTTFSTFATDGHALLEGGHLAVGGLYLAATALASVGAAAAGLALARRLSARAGDR